jgi:phage tail-like protein
MPETAAVVDPYRQYNWRIEVGNQAWAYFTACEGLGVSIDVIRYREAGNRQIARMIPGQVNYQPVTLHYGLTPSQDVFQWMMSGVEGRPDRRNVSIVVLDSPGAADMLRWNLEAAWVASWHGSKLDALSPDLAIESMTVVYERLTRAANGQQ